MLNSRLPITVRTEIFEGPLDLLLHLIQVHEMDISAVSVSKITDQYLSYVRAMEELNFEVASEFLVMAATLVYWKSKAVLPQEINQDPAENAEDEGILSQEDLIRQLLEHQRFLAAGEQLAQLPKLQEDVFVRSNQRPMVERIWREMNISDLALGYQDILIRVRKRSKILPKETVSLSEKMVEFAQKLSIGQMTRLQELMHDPRLRPEILVTFLASLELARIRKLRIYQNEIYSPIFVELIEQIAQADLHLASGFDRPAPPPVELTPSPAMETHA